jgi:hypothetical protein
MIAVFEGAFMSGLPMSGLQPAWYTAPADQDSRPNDH